MATNLPSASEVFTRASSGLVRQVRTRDVFFYGWQVAGLSFVVLMVPSWGTYPGASMELASLLAIIGGVAIALCYGLVATVYPRSGADYVFLSRSLNPAVGFTLSFSFAVWDIFYVGTEAGLVGPFAVAPLLAAIGIQAHSPALLHAASWFSSPIGIFLGGTAVLLLIGYLYLRGSGVYFRWQRWVTLIAYVSIGITIVVLVLTATGVLDFPARFDRLAGAGAYANVVSDGTAAGAAPAAPFSLAQTARFVIWPAFLLWFAVQAVSFTGEIKDVRRSQLVGIVGSVVTFGTVLIVLLFLYRAAFGDAFLLSAAAKGIPLDAPSQVPLFTAIAGGNMLVTILTGVWVVALSIFITGATGLYSTRCILAWSIDGMAPRRLGDVNDRYHSPHWASLMVLVVGEITLAMYAFTHLLGLISGFLGLSLMFLVMTAWCALFPFVRRQTFENSPIAWRIGPVPVLTIVGAIGTVFVIPLMYRLTRDTAYSPNLTFVLWSPVVVLAVGIGWYYGWRAFQKRRGVDIDRRYAQIPIE